MITIDTREPKGLVAAVGRRIEPQLPPLPRSWAGRVPWSHGAVTVAKLDFGDYWIEGPGGLLIERKEVKDLVSTYTTRVDGTSRLRRQLAGCADRCENVALLVEGTLEEDDLTGFVLANGHLRQVRFQSIVRLLVDLQREGTLVIRTASDSETVATIAGLHRSLRIRRLK